MIRLSLPALLGLGYGLSEIVLLIWRRSKTRESKSQDRHSLALLWIVIIASIYASVWIASAYRGASLSHPRLLSLIGTGLFAGGIALRWWSIGVLGKFFTVDVAISREHRVVQTGPYRLVRHPSYTGALIALLGYGLCLDNWLSIMCLMAPITLAFLRRIQVEERALIAALGNDYLNYARKTKRLIPFLL